MEHIKEPTATTSGPHSLNLKLTDPIDLSQAEKDTVRINAEGQYYFNDVLISAEDLNGRLLNESRSNYAVILIPVASAPIDAVEGIIDMFQASGVNGILTAEE